MKQGRIREKYNPTPTAREKAFHLWVIGEGVCECGCGSDATEFHHILESHPLKRWRRDHRFGIPMFWRCHRALHAAGNERKFAPDQNLTEKAVFWRERGYETGMLP